MAELPSLPEGLPEEAVWRLEAVCCRFEEAWLAGQRARPEDFVAGAEGSERLALLRELLWLDVHYRRQAGERPSAADYRARFPEAADVLQEVLAAPGVPDSPPAPEPGDGDPERTGPELLHSSTDEGHPPKAGPDGALGADAGPPLPGSSRVVQALGAPPVRVCEAPSGPTAPVKRPDLSEAPAPPDPSARLRLQGEIGRGGMGAVLKGHDIGLGRDVAVKVLLEAHAGRTELVQRFVEEAQVAGQLQHPGVVPVYDLGVFPDRRPYFTMKLVKGRTLSGLLAERADPTQDRPRFLGIFLQVCQAVAYAHARGVIHRDLKPQNVMVGAFGEVQVMDWGLAKVLEEQGGAGAGSTPRQAGSVIHTARGGVNTQAGTVLGTPSYMAPEQASGEVGRLDERADVFALGALLCEILTGRPPYAGGDVEGVRRRAARADLGDAFARLDGCGADTELVTLAKRCLAAGPGERPRDAGALAAELTAYLEGVERRLRRAELERAAAEGRAEEAKATARAERRARRLTLGLAASVLALVLAGGGVWVLNERAREAREARQVRTGQELNEALGRFAALRDEALAGWPSDVAKWGAAEAALQAAESVLAAGEAGTGQREQLEEARRDFDRETAEATRDRAMLSRLEGVLLETYFRTTGSHKRAWENAGAGYAAAFRDYGIDVPSLPAEEASARLRGRRIIKELAAALDFWAMARHKASGGGMFAPATRHLLAVAALADPEPWRQRLHAAQLKGDLEGLRALAGAADVREVPRPILMVLADILTVYGRRGSQDDVECGAALLRRAYEAHPEDHLLASQLAFAVLLYHPPRLDENVRYLSAAVALRPDVAHHRLGLGIALVGRGAYDEALVHIRRVLELSPGSALGHSSLALLYQEQKKFKEAIAEGERAVALGPGEPVYLSSLGALYMMTKQYDRAEELFRKAVALDPHHPEANANLGLRREAQNRLEEAAACFRAAIRGNPRLAGVYDSLAGVLKKQGRPEQAAQVYRDGLKQVPDDLKLLINYGNLLRDLKDDDAALEQFEEAIRRHPKTDWGYLNKALVLIFRNDRRAAVPLLRRCLQIDPSRPVTNFHLGVSLGQLGDLDGGVAYLRTAHDLDPRDAKALSRLGELLGRKKQYAEAIRVLKEAVSRDGGLAEAQFNLGVTLGAAGQHREAIPHLEKAVELEPNDAQAHSSLGVALYNAGRVGEAVRSFREAIRLDRGSAFAHCGLASALKRQGDFKEALEYAESGHRLGQRTPGWSQDTAGLVQECRQLVALDELLPKVIRGEAQATATEALALAALCQQYKRRYAAAARFFAEAFTLEPTQADNLEALHRYHAACAAALAAGNGEDAGKLDDKERTRLRKQALDWLRADLAAYTHLAAKGKNDRQLVQQRLTHWRQDTDLTALRDEKALSALPEAERKVWQKLWADVAALLSKVEGK
jgi:serine/threonine-protein kinase